MLADPMVLILMYFILPVWLIAGFADWLCHRATHIESTTGAKESLIHLLMFAEVGIPLLAAMFLEVNALVIAVMIVAFFVHEATAMWDVRYATTARTVGPIEQHVHSFLEMIPLMGLVIVVALHWRQFLALFGAGPETARFDLTWKHQQLPVAYIAVVMIVIVLFELLPYVEEFFRGLRANSGRLVPAKARRHEPGDTATR
ncbi:diguanylate cyclase [Mesorhizobium sp. M2D.F.Ca.ET.185.01.1.1]|uniref:diguanylate cyclase n=1 Tax=unclassified Mesorhizobium TaxID=325217 RepID=UPI000FCB880C|nr:MULTISPECIES: diguanylate cyclase [unclassified Mesorhizobium]TGP82835.1 diguanylate cyclase [bacterium M00.F.Ca.ET.227.01.1.1]TGP94577.1 diguanylate cyclase [bacterium M00.F.Ca.ET.221.01.1.1]TGP98031.1 diguanylate cyclase [bacterium M00.F.Ca.ET.222.01.1.1]TGT74858.1 diguanylate cyclase [bacterium M00.F.Ca.ET.159.01.1.1]TGT87726.1 diguanylate cyclase [bacterium M00.F.Ca.ET.157.01.1.1]TGU02133.1 diguanylate cyclase [bacterium M00.F.Ca.ET.163.01.1.1]TGU19566.1 diguanylate cyclase [bacterium